MRKKIIFFIVLILFLSPIPFAFTAEQPSAIICVIEKNGTELQGVGMSKTIISGVLAGHGWNVIDTNAFPVTATGEDLTQYLAQRGGQKSEFKSSSLYANITPQGEVTLRSKNIQSLDERDLKNIPWRVDLDELQSIAKSSGVRYILYGEITTKTVPHKEVPKGFATEGFNSVIAIANLRLVDSATRSVLATFVDQAPALQLTVEQAQIGAVQAIGKQAGEYFAKQISSTASQTVAPAEKK